MLQLLPLLLQLLLLPVLLLLMQQQLLPRPAAGVDAADDAVDAAADAAEDASGTQGVLVLSPKQQMKAEEMRKNLKKQNHSS